MAPKSKTVRALSKMKWFPKRSMHEAKLVAGASELVEPVKEGKLACSGVWDSWSNGISIWKKLIGSLCLLSPPEQGVVYRQRRPGPLNLTVLLEWMYW